MNKQWVDKWLRNFSKEAKHTYEQLMAEGMEPWEIGNRMREVVSARIAEGYVEYCASPAGGVEGEGVTGSGGGSAKPHPPDVDGYPV